MSIHLTSPLTTKGDIMVRDDGAIGQDVRLGVGSDGAFLIADSGETVGIRWGQDIGSLGIGTSSPDRPIEVVDDTQAQIRLTDTDATYYTDLRSVESGSLFDGFAISPTNNASGYGAITLFGESSDLNAFSIFKDSSGKELWLGRRYSPDGGSSYYTTVFGVGTGAKFSFRINFSEIATYSSTGVTFQVPGSYRITDSATSTVTTILDLLHTTSGTAAAGFGIGFLWRMENASGSNIQGMSEYVTWEVATGGSETATYQMQLYRAGTSRDFFHIYPNAGEIVFNEEGQSIDFRVESSTTANAFKILGASGKVLVGTSSAASGGTLIVNGLIDSVNSGIKLGGDPGSGVSGYLTLQRNTSSATGGTPSATLGNYGAAGQPAAAAQSHWLKIYDGTTTRYLPVWT